LAIPATVPSNANERVDELLELGRTEGDPEKRAAILCRSTGAHQSKKLPWAFLIATMEVNACGRQMWTGFVAHPAGHHDLPRLCT